MSVDPNDVASYTIGGFAIGGTAFWLLRWVIRTFHVDKLAIKSTTAEGNVKVYSVEVIVEDTGAGNLDQTVYVGAYDGNIYSAGGIEIYG